MTDKKFYSEITDEFITLFKDKVVSAKSIVVSSHTSPDDDSISSVLGIHYYLTEVLKIAKDKINIFYTGEKTDTWIFFERYSEIKFVNDIYNHIAEEDLIIFLDGSGWRRFSRSEEIAKIKNYVICIDHHPTPEDIFDLHLVATQYPASVEIIYRLFLEKESLDKEICEIILMGILGDTGNFRFIKPDQSSTLGIAERLINDGSITVESLQSKYQSMSIVVYKTLQELMKNSKIEKAEGWPEFIVSYLTLDYINENKLDDNVMGEASGLFAPYLKSIKGIGWGFTVTPKLADGMCRISLRSIPNSVSVRDIMEKTKFGGGHDRAAGGKVKTNDPEEGIKILLRWMSDNKPVMN